MRFAAVAGGVLLWYIVPLDQIRRRQHAGRVMLTIAGAFAGGRFDPRAMLARGAGWLSARDRARSRAAEPTLSPRRAAFPGRPFPWEASYPPGIAWDVDLPE